MRKLRKMLMKRRLKMNIRYYAKTDYRIIIPGLTLATLLAIPP